MNELRITVGGGPIDKNCIRVPLNDDEFEALPESVRLHILQLVQKYIKEFGRYPLVFKSVPICN